MKRMVSNKLQEISRHYHRSLDNDRCSPGFAGKATILAILLLVIPPSLIVFLHQGHQVGILAHAAILAGISIISVLYILFNQQKFSKLFLFAYFLLLVILIFIHATFMGYRNEISVLYFPILLSLQVCFTKPEHKFFSYFIFMCVCLAMTIGHIYGFRLFFADILGTEFNKNVRIIAYSESFILTITCGKILLHNNHRKDELELRFLRNVQEIQDLKQKKESLTYSGKSQQLLALISGEVEPFLEAFKHCYPGFSEGFIARGIYPSVDEYRLAAYIKMGLTTKEIANASGLTIRTVQTKKNRLRKTLGIPSDINLYNWLELQERQDVV